MSRLQELIAELCPGGVEYKALGEITACFDSMRKPVTKSARVAGEYPYYGASGIQDYVADYIFDGAYVLIGEDGSVIDAHNHPVVNWVEGRFWCNNHAHILQACDGLELKYLYYALQNTDVRLIVRGTPPKLNRKNLDGIRIPVPPIEVQREVVRVLDEYTAARDELIRRLEEEMALREQQLSIARNELLACVDGVRWATLDEIAWVGSSKRVFAKEFEAEGIPFFRGTEIGMFAEKKQVEPSLFISREHYENLYAQTGSPRKGDLLFPSICPDGRVWLVDRDDPFYIKDGRVLWIHPTDENIDSGYLCHAFSQFLRSSYNKLASGTSFAELKIFAVKKCRLPFPPLAEQKRIVALLDGLTEAVDDSVRRLNQDVELQLKQLALIRNQLLSFPEKVA